jgi:hypothetical protein
MKTMAIHAEAVEILVRKSRFEPEVALGIAEAIEVSINLAQLVTVPVLDARMLELKTELKMELKTEIQALRLEFKTELAEGLGKLSAELGKLSTEIQRVNANLMRWVLLTMLGSTVLNMAARSLMNTLSN